MAIINKELGILMIYKLNYLNSTSSSEFIKPPLFFGITFRGRS